MSSLNLPKMPNGGQPGAGSSLSPKIHMPADGAADAVGKGATFAAKLKTYAGIIVATGMVAAIVVVTAAVAGASAGRPDDKDSGEPSDSPRREQPEYLIATPDFLGTVELLEPQWSDDLADDSNDENRELSALMEVVIDFIYDEGDTDNVFNYTIVTGFSKTHAGKVQVNYDLHLTSPTPQLAEYEVEETFKDGYIKMLTTKSKDRAVKVNPNTNKVNKLETTTFPTPATINNTDCGLAHLYPGPCDNTARIVDGSPTCMHAYPWVVMLIYQGRYLCGGAIWDSQHIVTAAHCIYSAVHVNNTSIPVNTTDLAVIAGRWKYGTDPSSNTITVWVAAASVHANYTRDTYEHDIAILKLEHPIEENQTQAWEKVCRPDNNQPLPREGIVAGWGSVCEEPPKAPEYLMEVKLNLYDSHNCSRIFSSSFDNGDINRFLHEGSFCAARGLGDGANACQGDSGGPLFARVGDKPDYIMFGIVSNGFGCGRVGNPGFYTYVPHYLGWIEETIKLTLKPY